MSRVLLGHSYFLRFDPKLWRAMQPYPPIGTLYAAAMLRQAGHDVRFFDAMLATSTAEWDEMLKTEMPDVAVLFEDNFNYLSKMCLLNMRQAAFAMIAAANDRGCPIIVCGADVTDHAALYLDAGADFVVIGEGDETVVELVGVLASGETDLSSIAGLVYRTPAGETTSTGLRPVIRDLDSLPAPARDLVDLDRYRRAWQRHGRFSMNLVASRGCSFHCNWCAKPIWGQRHNTRTPGSVADEIETLHSLGAEHLWLMDDILGIKPGWLAELASLLQQRGLTVPFKCLSRADLLLRPGEIDALREAGCETVWIGAESGSQKVLDAMEKGTSVGQIREATHRLKEAGIKPAFFLQFGYPGENWEDILATFQLVRDCRPDDIGMSVSYPLPGTPFYERVKDSMSARSNWVDSEEMPMLYKSPYSTEFYHQVHAALHAEFRIRRATQGASAALTSLRLVRAGKLHDAASLLKDATLRPLYHARLNRAASRSESSAVTLPVRLSRLEAGTPSDQGGTPELMLTEAMEPRRER
jgi:radical SAM superfamily enzyme YgiQ (UPF0313 family)